LRGSAAVFFHLQPSIAWLNDINGDLINAYLRIKNHWRPLYSLLLQYQKAHNSNFYYATRAHKPTGLLEQAARFIYLNRTCLNGIYRVNRQGDFNVPIGSKTNVVLEDDDFLYLGC